MSTLLDRTSLPIWVFIVIIVVGSICILATVALIIRCIIVKKRARTLAADEFSAPMRRVTVRRGRIVPQSHYLSLTGSKFGLNEFDNDASTVRSKSPFEWWSKVNKKQGQDDMSQRGSIYGRRDFAQSSNSLAISTTPEKQPAGSSLKEVEAAPPSPTALPSPRASPSPSASPARSHFSRPFHSTVPGSPFLHDRRLSMIEEAASPHTSIISTISGPRSSKISISPTDGNLTRYEPKRGSRRPSNNTPTASTHSLPSQVNKSQHDVLMPLAYRGSRSSLGEIEQPRPSLSHRSSTNSRHDSLHEYYQEDPYHRRGSPRSPSMPSMAEEQAQVEQQQQHWNGNGGQNPQFPVRVASRKGNVLRKKSLKRMEIVSTVG